MAKIDLTKYKSSPAGKTVDSSEDEVLVKEKYTPFSWFLFNIWGTTRMPYEVNFYCKESGEWFEKLTDPELIRHYILYRRK